MFAASKWICSEAILGACFDRCQLMDIYTKVCEMPYLHPESVGTLLSYTSCVSIKLSWKQSLLFTEQIPFYVKWWTITTITLSTISISSIKIKLPCCFVNHSHPEWNLTLVHMTGEKSLIMLGREWKVLSFAISLDSKKMNHVLWIVSKLSCPHTKNELSVIYQKRHQEYQTDFMEICFDELSINEGKIYQLKWYFLSKIWVFTHSWYCQIWKYGQIKNDYF